MTYISNYSSQIVSFWFCLTWLVLLQQPAIITIKWHVRSRSLASIDTYWLLPRKQTKKKYKIVTWRQLRDDNTTEKKGEKLWWCHSISIPVIVLAETVIMPRSLYYYLKQCQRHILNISNICLKPFQWYTKKNCINWYYRRRCRWCDAACLSFSFHILRRWNSNCSCPSSAFVYDAGAQINMHDISIGNIRDWWYNKFKSIIQFSFVGLVWLLRVTFFFYIDPKPNSTSVSCVSKLTTCDGPTEQPST